MVRKILLKVFTFFSRDKKKYKFFKEQFRLFKEMDTTKKLKAEKKDWYPFLNDNTTNTGFDAHYTYHPAWAARVVKQINPSKHIDISSTLHFCSILSAFITTEFYDFRPAELTLSNLYTGKADLTDLFFETSSIECLSCMHTVEHIGLGRYGDLIDPDADIRSINELKRVVVKNGSILFVTPVGNPKIMFNAHRIYDPNMIVDLFNGCKLEQFSLITDEGKFVNEASLDLGLQQNYGCGCFWFIKN